MRVDSWTVWPPKWPWEGAMLSAPLSLLPTVKSTSAGDAHDVCFHLFSFWLVRKAQNWRGQWGGGGGTGRTHCKGMLSLPREQLPWRLPASRQFSNRPFCSRAANDAIKFIRRTSVLNDRTTGCPLREAGLKQLKKLGARGLKTSPAILSVISKLNRKYPWRLCRHLRTEVCLCHGP